MEPHALTGPPGRGRPAGRTAGSRVFRATAKRCRPRSRAHDAGGPVRDGIGEPCFIAVPFCLFRSVERESQVELHAAALANSSLKVKNPGRNDLFGDDHRIAAVSEPNLGLRFTTLET